MSLFNDDYTFCANPDHCSKKNECKRAESKPGIHSYSLFYDPVHNDCDYFWKKENVDEALAQRFN